MRLVVARSRLARIALVAAGLLVLLGAVARPHRVESYRAITLANLPWGAGGVTTFTAPGNGTSYGPRSFAIGRDGTVYVADTWGGRVWMIVHGSRRGPLAIPLRGPGGTAPTVDDVAADGEGGLYVADNRARSVWHVDPDGRATVYYEVDGRSVSGWVVQGLAVGQDGTPVIDAVRVGSRTYEREVRRLAASQDGQLVLARQVIDEKGARIETSVSNGAFTGETLGLGVDGSLYVVAPGQGSFDRDVHVFDALGRHRRTIGIHTKAELREAQLVGVDGEGAIYLGLNLGSPEGRILKVRGDGRAAWSVSVPMSDGTPVLGVYARVDLDGNLFLLAPTPAGLELREFSRTSRWALGGK